LSSIVPLWVPAPVVVAPETLLPKMEFPVALTVAV
jgi:hypothetical protein